MYDVCCEGLCKYAGIPPKVSTIAITQKGEWEPARRRAWLEYNA